MKLLTKPFFGALLLCAFVTFNSKAQIFTPELTSEDRSDTQISGPLNLFGTLSATNKMDVKLNATSWGVSAPTSKNNHLRLRSNNTGNSLDYIGLQFEMQGQYWNMIRVNFNGFHFTDGDSFSYRKLYASGFHQSSDLTLKTNINTLIDPLDKINSLRGVSFNWVESGEPSIGFIAQEVQEVLPELVQGMEGGLSVEYSNIVAVAVEAIKELKAENESLKTRLEVLEAAVAELQGN